MFAFFHEVSFDLFNFTVGIVCAARSNNASALSWFYLDVITLENIFTWIAHRTEKRTLKIHIQRVRLQISNRKTLPTYWLLCRVDIHYLLDVTLCSWVKDKNFKELSAVI